MNILSLFDGMSCGRIALERANIKVDKYYASEIDKYAKIVSNKNYPDIIQLGDITKWNEWNIEKPDIIIGGSPCQGFSFAGKQLNFKDERSKLFFVYLDILKHYKPKYFLLENVIMKKESENVISELLGEVYPECIKQVGLFGGGKLEPIMINSALVSAQNRKRLYWTNIPGVTQPKDKGILLKDIIDSEDAETEACLTPKRNEYGKKIRKEYENKQIKEQRKNMTELVPRKDGKTNTLTGVQKDNLIVKCGAFRGRNPENPTSRIPGLDTVQMLEIREDEKTNCLTSVGKDTVVVYTKNYIQYETSANGYKSAQNRIYHENAKSACVSSALSNSMKLLKGETEDKIYWRKLTPEECEKLQTVPVGYTKYVSNSQRYRMLGNGWTVDVIAHIFNHITK